MAFLQGSTQLSGLTNEQEAKFFELEAKSGGKIAYEIPTVPGSRTGEKNTFTLSWQNYEQFDAIHAAIKEILG